MSTFSIITKRTSFSKKKSPRDPRYDTVSSAVAQERMCTRPSASATFLFAIDAESSHRKSKEKKLVREGRMWFEIRAKKCGEWKRKAK